MDCTDAVTATPSAAGARSAAVSVSLPSGTWQNLLANLALNGTATGSVLAIDNAFTTNAFTTTAVAPTTSTVFSSIVPAGVALDGAGNVYARTACGRDRRIDRRHGQHARDDAALQPRPDRGRSAGNVFAVGTGTSTIQELKVTGPPASSGGPSTLTSATIAYTPTSRTAPPQAIAVDAAGNLFVANYQATGSSIYRLSLTPNTRQTQSTVASGLSNSVSLAGRWTWQCLRCG